MLLADVGEMPERPPAETEGRSCILLIEICDVFMSGWLMICELFECSGCAFSIALLCWPW